MRDIFEDLFKNEPLDPTEAARRAMRPQLRRRFYKDVTVAKARAASAWCSTAARCGRRRGVRSPRRRSRWRRRWPTSGARRASTSIPPVMPLTRLANSIIDGVADAPGPVADEIAKYLGSDLAVLSRRRRPTGWSRARRAAWDPVIAWARDALGARFVLGEGVALRGAARAGARGRARRDARRTPWRLGAVHSITTLTGSALIALAVLRGRALGRRGLGGRACGRGLEHGAAGAATSSRSSAAPSASPRCRRPARGARRAARLATC